MEGIKRRFRENMELKVDIILVKGHACPRPRLELSGNKEKVARYFPSEVANQIRPKSRFAPFIFREYYKEIGGGGGEVRGRGQIDTRENLAAGISQKVVVRIHLPFPGERR